MVRRLTLFVLFLLTAHLSFGSEQSKGWLPVKHGVKLVHNLEETPLEIKTSRDSDSYEYVLFYTAEDTYAGLFEIGSTSTPVYRIGWCNSSYSEFPTTIRAASEMIWRFKLDKSSGIRVKIHCNGMPVLDVLVSDKTCTDSEWKTYWKRPVEKISFMSITTRAQYYKPRPGTKFKLVDEVGNAVQREGGETSLLLYKWGTVCNDHFDSNAADAICREMGHTNARGRWNSGNDFSYQADYDISLDDVRCDSGDWSDCTYAETHDCGHAQDVFLACDVPPKPGDADESGTGSGTSSYTFQAIGTTIKNISATGSNFSASYKVTTINGTIKGPAIHVKNGWTLWVKVINGLTDGGLGLSIHWHGLNMRKNQVFDGVVGLTQCPIALNDSFLYNWTINEQPGTYWYHTHDRKLFPDNQKDFIKGPLIIHEAQTRIPESTTQDSYQIGNERILFYIMIDDDNNVGVVNGEKHPIIQVENGEYRFRIINGGGQTIYFFSIGSYRLTVVATDGYSVKPYETDVIQIGIAERYDVMMKFNISNLTKDECIRALNREQTEQGLFATLRIRKNGSVPLDNTTKDMNVCKRKPTIKDKEILNCYDETSNNYRCTSVTALNSTLKRSHYPRFEYHTVKIMKHSNESWKVAIDSNNFKENKIPCRAAILDQGRSSRRKLQNNTNILPLREKASVTIVLLSNTMEQHPMHSHGHHYEVLEIYAPTNASAGCPFPYVNTAFSEPIEKLMERSTQGVLKDTVLLPRCGAVAVRLNSDNRGVWFFHCHIDWHLHHGLAWLLDENSYMFTRKRSELPKDYPPCKVC